MKYNLTALLLLASLFAGAQQPGLVVHNYDKRGDTLKKPKYNLSQFIGRWQEMGRVKSANKEWVEVTDTFYIHFYENGKADTKQGNSGVITGTVEIYRNDNITTSANDFKIISVLPDKIILDDNMGYMHSLSRVDQFAYEKVTPPPVVIPDTSKAVIDLSGNILVKSWFAYKREAAPGFISNATAVIRKLKIQIKKNDTGYLGEVEFAQSGKALVQPCIFSVRNNILYITTAGNDWSLEIYKSDGMELVMGKQGELVYYCKPEN